MSHRAAPADPSRPVLVVGPTFLDVVMSGLSHATAPGEEQWVEDCALMPGGAANQAVALARLGLPTGLCTYLGADPAGRMVRDMLESEGIGLSGARTAPRQSVTVSLALDGDRAMTTCGCDAAPGLPAGAPAPAALVADLGAVRAGRETIARWRAEATPTAVFADAAWDPTGRWSADDLAPLDRVDVFTPNETEALHYTRAESAAEAARLLAERVPVVVVTRGPAGVIACDGGDLFVLPALEAPVVDTTGAGDAFTAGLVWARLHGLALRAAVSLASATAAATLGRPGGSLNAPTPAQVAALVRATPLPDGFSAEFLDLIADGATPDELTKT
ncbi:Sugar or nucleoside kinase, ribokinase family [Actinomyces ruminicola]|uniref:Sugar or nucleoside kinase, ribokinase family n=1 Tax=Actinomyces ruminicola TaxID=332524 RepID=A0A1H0F771_9ACTO|nr:carbohydrate kinase family protein [Actinomyces ruminicola]SDN90392.1 Sugar or nucleoside kinase, ribokinase family [Actinomyces ruminicola]